MLGLLVTMDAEQGVEAVRLIDAGTSIPVHYDVFTSSLDDFLEAPQAAGLPDRVLPVARGETVSLAGAALANGDLRPT